MRLVIDIPEGIYKASQILDVKYEDTVQIPLEVIANGTPLPSHEDAISKTGVREFVEYIQSIKDKHNVEGSPINYGTICDLVIRGWKLLDDIQESLPPVNPQKSGHWIKHKLDDFSTSMGYSEYGCSECGAILKGQALSTTNYCPNCGCKMVATGKRG